MCLFAAAILGSMPDKFRVTVCQCVVDGRACCLFDGATVGNRLDFYADGDAVDLSFDRKRVVLSRSMYPFS